MTAESVRPTRSGSRTRVGWVDYAKGMAIIAVVYFHVTLFFGEEGVDGALGRVKLAFELFPMPAFFLVSGLFNNRAETWTFGQLWRRRLLPILYLYVLWSLLRFTFYSLFPFLATDAADMTPTNPLTLALLPVLPTSSYWFVYALALFTLLAWAMRRVPPVIQIALAAIASTLITTGLVTTHTIAWDRICALFLFFLLGSLYSKHIRVFVARARPWVVVAAFGALVALVALRYLMRGVERWPFYVVLAQLLAVFIGFQVARVLSRYRVLGFVSVVGRQSLPVYLIHLFLIAPLAVVVGLFTPDWPRWVDITVCVATTAFVVAACLGIARATSRVRWLYTPTPWLTRVLSGRRTIQR